MHSWASMILPVHTVFTWLVGYAALIGASRCLDLVLVSSSKDANGKVIKAHAIPGHNLPLGALGVFILWFGWYGFNGAAATTIEDLGSIFLTTTVAPAVATVTCMIFTWIKIWQA